MTINLEEVYTKSINFHSSLLNTNVQHNKQEKKIYEFLNIKKDINYFDTLSTYLILYIYPKLFSENKKYNNYLYYILIDIYTKILIFIKKFIFIFPFWVRNYSLNRIIKDYYKYKSVDDSHNKKLCILFPIFTESHYFSVLGSVVHELSRKENISISLLFKDFRSLKMFNEIKKCKLFSIDMCKRLYDDERSEKIHLFLTSILSTDSIYLNLCKEYGISYFLLKNTLMSVFSLELFKLNIYHQLYDKMIKDNKIDLIVSSDHADQRVRLLVQIYKSFKVKSIVIQQGISSKNYPEWNNLLNDFVMANGKLSAKIIESQGVDKSSIYITGHPGFDVFNTIKNPPGSKNKRYDLFNSENMKTKKIILFASQPFYINSFSSNTIRTQCIEALKSIININDSLFLIIKPHPFEEIGFLKKTFPKNSRIKILAKELDINLYIELCDIFVTMHSTTAFQAMSLNKPVITLDFDYMHEYSPFINSNSTYSAKNKQDLEFYINCLTNSKNYNKNDLNILDYKKFLNDSFDNEDGKATERIVNLIISI